MSDRFSKLRVSDPIITTVVHGYAQANNVASFVAPTVPVSTRAGKVIRFGKEAFVLRDTRRAYGSNIERFNVGYSTDSFALDQYAAAGEVVREAYEEALNGEAQINLRNRAAKRGAQAIALDWEREVLTKVTNPALYEASCTIALAGAAKFSNAGSDPEATVDAAREAIRTQIGQYPNSAIMSSDVFLALRKHPTFRDRIKYTNTGVVGLDLLAQWFELPRGIRVAQQVYLNEANNTFVDLMPAGTMLLFYAPEGSMEDPRTGTTFMPTEEADRAIPSFAYTYRLSGYPIAEPERFDEDRKVYVTDIIDEASIELTGLGANGKCGSGYLIRAAV